VVFDSLSEMRLLARDSLRYRRQILALKHYFTGRNCTVILLDYGGGNTGDFQLQSLTHGVIGLEQLAPGYGGQRRRLRIQKIRGIKFREGYHDYLIATGGMKVFPRLVAPDHDAGSHPEPIASGVPELDAMLGGGIHRGTNTMILGPAGVGKSTLTAQYVTRAAERGERSIIYSFDEAPTTWIDRAERLGMRIKKHQEAGLITLRQVEPAELTPGDLAEDVRRRVEDGVSVVVLDSLNGYHSAMPSESFLTLHLHELLSFLNQHGVLTFLIMAQHGILGQDVASPVDLSYIADTVLLLRYFEAFGQVRQAISTVKKRSGTHEHSIRELRIGDTGLRVGRELKEFHGILSGQLSYSGEANPLLEDKRENGHV
jgi:circadian clock protein KaiC